MTESLDENYARAGYHARQEWGSRPALLLVDFARAYFEPDSPLYGGEGCVTARDHAARLLDTARQTGTPVIFTEVRYIKGGADGGVFFKKAPPLKVMEWGSPLGDLVEGLERRPEEIMVTKQYPSAFFGTSLAATLTSMGVDTVLLTGLTTSGCIRATCVDAMSHGFVTLVVSDAVGDRAEGPHEANLFDMSAKYADLVTTSEAVDYLQTIQREQ
ncbi:isochorismatase [Rhodosalinus halophilus]|uniref:Isochorismatase n=1 Tax=Rhodosalinus halophilus TaxID=2259333 RepID=A0A365U6Y1_9RHOB|nr:isochorismatase family protein [Rhodosalinus halophilus]RBI84276.1 isochorismatase [Rhodosalinus halophilus]